MTPNEIEAEQLTGVKVTTPETAQLAAQKLLNLGAKAAVITLGEQGALYHDGQQTLHQPAFNCGAVVETTGAGDAFNGGFAVALAEGQGIEAALRFACATASLSVTRQGTAPAMPTRPEIEAVVSS